jgi:hypothetical protein
MVARKWFLGATVRVFMKQSVAQDAGTFQAHICSQTF